jgi:hypothetical protein
MRFKIFLLPFFIVAALVLVIGYIKPDFDVVMTKREEITSKEAQVANMKAVLENINSLNNSLDTEQEAEQFMYRYLPKSLNQEQVVDAFNFLALQSGLVITEMGLKLPQEKIIEEQLIDSSARSFVAGGKALDSSNASVPILPVKAKTFTLKGSVTGPYANIRDFFDRLAHIERFQDVRLFSIEASKKTEAGKASVSDNLIGTFEAEYGYLPPKPIASALNMPIFLQSNFDFSNVNILLSKITSPVPVLEKGTTGKPNPFQ